MDELTVAYMAIEKLKSNRRNARTHSARQIKQIERSIGEFGFNNPVLVDEDGLILAGHGRVEAAKRCGMATVPTVCLDHMSEGQKRAYVLADNRLAELAGWDEETLAIELQELIALDPEFEVEITGFSTAEIDLTLESAEADIGRVEDDGADQLPPIDTDKPTVTQTGDLWLLNGHRLLCGDARDQIAFRSMMDDQRARAAITDPPYNVRIPGHVSGKGQHRHNDFAMACGEMSDGAFTGFLSTVMGHMAASSVDGAIHFVFMDWRHIGELLAAGKLSGAELKNICVWVKDNGGLGSFYRSRHEFVGVFKVGNGPHLNNIELGRFGRNRTNVWEYPGMNSLGAEDRDQLAQHPTIKNSRMIADAILDCTRRGEVVLDPFLGSGSTVIAAEKVGRRCFGKELEPAYVDLAIRRWEDWTGGTAVHAETGVPFKDGVQHESSRPAKGKAGDISIRARPASDGGCDD